jgi:hypothetical protein
LDDGSPWFDTRNMHAIKWLNMRLMAVASRPGTSIFLTRLGFPGHEIIVAIAMSEQTTAKVSLH